MAFIKSSAYQAKGPVLFGNRLFLRMPKMKDYETWCELRQQSQMFLKQWEPVWNESELTKSSFRKRVSYYKKKQREGSSYAFFLFSRKNERLLGGLTLSNVRHGVIGSCSLGYWIGEPYAGNGYMREAIRTILPFAFGSLDLHRIEAACLPDNVASVNLLLKNGFTQEGVARKYLRINGTWQDHLLFALLKEDL